MANEIFGFEWQVPRNGYTIVELVGSSSGADNEQGSVQRFLWDGKDQSNCDPNRDYVLYNPLTERKALFRVFARLDGTEEAVLGFANKYGRLGGPVDSPHAGSIVGGGHTFGGLESVDDWRAEIQWTKDVLYLWKCFVNKDVKRVQCQLESMKMHLLDGQLSGVRWGPESPKMVKSLAMLQAEMRRLIYDKHPFAAAKICLWLAINTKLSELATPEIIWDPSGGKFTLQIGPKCLLGAIWLQIAMAMTGEIRHIECEFCGEWFEVHPDIARCDKRYCNNACRNKMFRKRKTSALRLCDQGLSPEQISIRLGADIQTVQNWLADAPKDKP